MIFIQQKIDGADGAIGILHSFEFNPMKNELGNVSFSGGRTSDPTDNTQMLQTVNDLGKANFFSHHTSSTVNDIVLVKGYSTSLTKENLFNDMLFCFCPEATNTGPVTLKFYGGTSYALERVSGGLVPDFLDPDGNYWIRFDSVSNKFILIGALSNSAFPTGDGGLDNGTVAVLNNVYPEADTDGGHPVVPLGPIQTENFSIDTESYILCDTTISSITITLPTPKNGRKITIMDVGGNADINNIVINPSGNSSIAGGTIGSSAALDFNRGTRHLLCYLVSGNTYDWHHV